jgi:hypothetical protein
MTGVDASLRAVTVDTAALQAFFNDPTGPAFADLTRRADNVQALARLLVGKRSGRLLATIRKNPVVLARGPAIDVVAGKPGLTDYLGFHHDGTPAHIIRARHAKALRFVSKGRVVFAQQVRHPSVAGTRFLVRALEAARD